MSKVKVKITKTFSTRELKRFDSRLVESKPVLYEGDQAILPVEACEYLERFSPGVIQRVPETTRGPEVTKTVTPPPPPPPATPPAVKGREEAKDEVEEKDEK